MKVHFATNPKGRKMLFSCPGCNIPHSVWTSGSRQDHPLWSWDNNEEAPTLQPSVLVTWSEPSDEPEEFDNPLKDIKHVCHLFLTNGKLQFLSDCTHDLAGKTVDLPDWQGY